MLAPLAALNTKLLAKPEFGLEVALLPVAAAPHGRVQRQEGHQGGCRGRRWHR